MIIKYIKKDIFRFIGASILLLLLSILAIFPAMITKVIIDAGFINRNFNIIIKLSILLGFLYIGKSILNYFTNKLFINIGQNLCLQLKSDVFSRLLRFPLDFFSDKDSGYIKSRISEVDKIIYLFTPQTFKIFLSIFEFLIVLVILFRLNINVTITMCIPLPIFYIISQSSMKQYKSKSNHLIEHTATYSGKINESLQGIEEIKTLSTEKHEEQKINTYNKKLVRLSVSQSNTLNLVTELISILTSLITVLALIICGYEVVNGRLSVGGVTAITMYVGKLYAPIMMLSTASITLQPSIISLQRINKLFYSKREGEEKNKKLRSITYIDSINFQNLYFKYLNREDVVLNNLSFEMKKNDVFIIKGANGAGKTTMIKLILKLYENYEGNILINNQSIKDIDDQSLKNNISIVSQKIFLFNDSIKNNILYGINSDVIEEDFKHVLQIVGLYDFINKLPMHEDTIIGERGVVLSGGQIQKIAIARAILKNSDVCIYDEASSHIDSLGKELLKNIIKHNKKNKITIIIDHSNYYDDISTKIINLSKNNTVKVGGF